MTRGSATVSTLHDPDDDAPSRLTWSPVPHEADILAVLEAPAMPGEQLLFAFRRKEAELMALFDQLSPLHAYELRRRLTLSLPDDQLAASFRRLIPERRQRLVLFLADVRRRESLRGRSR